MLVYRRVSAFSFSDLIWFSFWICFIYRKIDPRFCWKINVVGFPQASTQKAEPERNVWRWRQILSKRKVCWFSHNCQLSTSNDGWWLAGLWFIILHPWKLTWNRNMKVWFRYVQMMFLFKQVIFRFQPFIFQGVPIRKRSQPQTSNLWIGRSWVTWESWCSDSRLQICPRKTFWETIRHRWYQAGSKYWWNQGLAAWFRAKPTTLRLPPLDLWILSGVLLSYSIRHQSDLWIQDIRLTSWSLCVCCSINFNT